MKTTAGVMNYPRALQLAPRRNIFQRGPGEIRKKVIVPKMNHYIRLLISIHCKTPNPNLIHCRTLLGFASATLKHCRHFLAHCPPILIHCRSVVKHRRSIPYLNTLPNYSLSLYIDGVEATSWVPGYMV